MRWLVLDEVVSVERGIKSAARSKVPAEIYTSELLMIEMMAQTGGLLLGAESDFSEDVIFAKIEEASFDSHARAGQEILIEATSENLRSEGAWIDATIKQDAQLIGKSRLLLMSVGKLMPDSGKSITFHDIFMKHFDVRNKVNISANK